MIHNDDSNDNDNDFIAVKISLANPKKIREQSRGEVKKSETINYRSYKPERDGLFCEKIFGPEKDYECSCGKYRGMKFKGMICDHCGVEVAHNHVRRKRMGHIELAAPVVHIWFFKAASSRLATLLAMKASSLEKVVYFQDYVVLDPGTTNLKVGDTFNEQRYRQILEEEGQDSGLVVDMGAEAIRKLLRSLDVAELSEKLRDEIAKSRSKQRKRELVNRLRLVDALRNCKHENKPEWMVLDVIPVIPPDLRPLVMLDSGTFAVSDLNDLYRRIINRNSRLRKLLDFNAPDVIVRNEKRMLQQAVDALFDNQRCHRQVLGSNQRALKSLTDMIKGKQGRFRENLLGKRVDYSARSVIAVGPHMKLHQCGLPKPIALELYQPFIIRRLKELGHADTIKSAKKMLERRDLEVWDILEQVIQHHPVLLNRAPTLHRMGIQAFEPMLVEGNAIKLHPLVCKGFNADFDGDQMAVHLPLSIEAQVEAHTLMLSTHNIFSPAHGKPIISPSQDIVMGCFYITMDPLPGMTGEGMVFASIDEALLAYSLGKVHLNARIQVRMQKTRYLKNKVKRVVRVMQEDGRYVEQEREVEITEGKLFETTPGRIIFNQILPDNSPFYNIPQTSKELGTVISDCYALHGRSATIDLLDRMMRLGFEESTRSGLSFSTDDLITPKEKKAILEKADVDVQSLWNTFNLGGMQEEERYSKSLDVWTRANNEITEKMMETFRNDVYKPEEVAKKAGDVKRRKPGYVNPVYLMAFSGARGGTEQIRQLAGMRGLMSKPNGALIETPIKANFLEGLSVLEYFSSTHGARKGLSDTALKTADSGYMTRKLADVAQNCVVTEEDCGTTNGIIKQADPDNNVKLSDLIIGRVVCESVTNPITDEVIVEKDHPVTPEAARKIQEALPNLRSLKVRSPLTCEAELGVCSLCYGMDLSTQRLVEEGMAVGIIAAESIGEPGTQLTMRTFHIGGVGQHTAEEKELRTKYSGIIRFKDIDVVEAKDEKGEKVLRVLSVKPGGGVSICNRRGQARETYQPPEGAVITVKEGESVVEGATIATFEPHSRLIMARASGVVRFTDVEVGVTAREDEQESTGQKRLTILDLKGDRHPRVEIVSFDGKNTESYNLTSKTTLLVREGETVDRGATIASMPITAGSSSDITSGLPRITEIFEARRPKDPAVMAQIDGTVEILERKRHGKQIVVVRKEVNGETKEIEHEIPQGKRLRVYTGDEVVRGQQLTDGWRVPQDILAICGEIEVQRYLVEEIQKVYRSQNVSINDKHIEIIVSQMLRRVQIKDGGDTPLLQGDTVDRFELRRRNNELKDCVKVVDPGDTSFREGEIVAKLDFDSVNAMLAESKPDARLAEYAAPRPARWDPMILGVTKAAVQSDSFLSAASFQETTKVLTEAALSYKIDRLIGLKENVVVGRLIPAGTGFHKYQKAECRYANAQVEFDATNPLTLDLNPDMTLLNDVPVAEQLRGFDAVSQEAALDRFIGDADVNADDVFGPEAEEQIFIQDEDADDVIDDDE